MTRTRTPWGMWEPASVAETTELFARVDAPWWIAGGYAIELAVGERLREHVDIDVLLLRVDQHAVWQALPGWQWWMADPPGTLRRWAAGQTLPAHVHDIWCRPGPDLPWRVQVMLDESIGADWVSRHSPRIRRPITTIGATSPDGVPYLSPEIQLFYKARNPRPKDQTDFTAALPHLSTDQRRWLHDTIGLAYGPHPWQDDLRTGTVPHVRAGRPHPTG